MAQKEHTDPWMVPGDLRKRSDRPSCCSWHPLCSAKQRCSTDAGASVECEAERACGGKQDEIHVVRDSRARARWVLQHNPNSLRGVCRVQGLVVQRGPNRHRARVRREAGIPIATERETVLNVELYPLAV